MGKKEEIFTVPREIISSFEIRERGKKIIFWANIHPCLFVVTCTLDLETSPCSPDT